MSSERTPVHAVTGRGLSPSPSPPSQVRPSYSFSPRLSRPPFQPRDDEIKVGLRQSIINYFKRIAAALKRSAQPQTLEYIDVPIPSLGKNEVKIKIATIGLSYYDFKRRIWNYTLKGTPPYIAGYQGSGVVVESKCTNIAVGTNVAFTDVPFSNADFVIVPLANVMILPGDIEHALATFILLLGVTAHDFRKECYATSSLLHSRIILIHAAAEGVGKLLTQMCKLEGATVIGLSQSSHELQVILDNGADYAIPFDPDWISKVMTFTAGQGVDVVFANVGSTLNGSLEVTKSCGKVVF